MPYRHSRTALRAGSLLFIACLSSAAVRTDPASKARVLDTYGKLPLTFEQNQGQTNSQVKFLARGSGYTLFLTPDSAVLALQRERAASVLRMKLLGANRNPAIAGTDALPGKSNYFVGNDPSKWRTNVPTYAKVKYQGVYPGIDLVYYGNQRLLEYDFLFAPGADPRAIELRFQGAKKLSVNDDGALVLDVGGGEVIEHAPTVYQEIAGERRTLAGRYVLRGKGRVGFKVTKYDRDYPLVIDPTLVYSTLLGGGGKWEFNQAYAIAVDASGNAYVTGRTTSGDFPTTPGAFMTTAFPSQAAAFVTKLNATGSALVYSTYLAVPTTFATGIRVDGIGNAYIIGLAQGSFPITPGAFQTTCTEVCAFVSKLNPEGSGLVYSTYLGNTYAYPNGIALDAAGNAYVTGFTDAADFPTTKGAFRTTPAGSSDAFVTKLNAAGSALVYSTYLGGSDSDSGVGIAVDASGNAYVTGGTTSPDFPTTAGSFQGAYGGNSDAFVTKLNPTGSAVIYSTYLGGSGGDSGSGIAVDISGTAYVVGDSSSLNFPTTPGAFQTAYGGGPSDIFVSRLNASGSALTYSTYLGGGGKDQSAAIAVDSAGNAYITGWALPGFPTTPGALADGTAGSALVTKLNPTESALAYSTYLEGGLSGNGIAVDSSGNVYVTGNTMSPDFPTTPGAFQTTLAGQVDIFVSKLSLGTFVAPPVTTGTVTGPKGNSDWYLGSVTVTLTVAKGGGVVAGTYYSVDGGSYEAYVGPFAISLDGVHALSFYSADTAGNQEAPHGQTIKIDATKPVSHVAALPATESTPNFVVSWTGSDATSGVLDFSVYVSDNGGGFAPWLTHTAATQASFPGTFQHSYGFFATARDIAGNEENLKTTAEASTRLVPIVGDVNSDGKIDCTDIAIVKASLGKKTGQTGFDPRADVNKDGVVDVRDLAIVAQKLPAGTKCP